MDLPGPSLSSTESSRVSDSYGTYDDLDYDDDQSSSTPEQSELTSRPTKRRGSREPTNTSRSFQRCGQKP